MAELSSEELEKIVKEEDNIEIKIIMDEVGEAHGRLLSERKRT